jgi:hypothetical protein
MTAFVSRSDAPLHCLEIDQPGPRLAVGEDGRRAQQLDGVRARGEGERRDEHLVAPPHAGEPEAKEQTGRGGREAAHPGGRQALLESGLERADLGPRDEPAGAKRVDDLGDLLLAQIRAREMQKRRPL